LVAIVVSILLVELTMLLLDMGPETLLVAAIVSVVASATWCLATLSGTASFTELSPYLAVPTPSVGNDLRVRMRSALWSADGSSYKRLHGTLVELIDDQLEHAYGVTRRHDPAAAKVTLGPELYAFAQNPDGVTSLSRTAELNRIVTLIERL
jgi:hypothetical protein